MEKKKAIKIVTATAIAASAFTAVAPAQSEAASNLDTQISKAKSTMKKPYDTYTQASKLASVKTVSTGIAAAKKAESDAIKAINKAKLSAKAKKQKIADLKKYEVYITRAQGYVNGYNAAAKASAALATQYAELANAVAATDAADNVAGITAKYTALQNAIKAAKKQIAAVYGSTTRTLLNNQFTKPTEDKLAAGVVKVLAEIKAAKENADAYVALANGDLSTQAKVDAAQAAKAKIDLTKLNTTDKAAVTAADVKVAAAVEALAVPQVTEVSTSNGAQLVVKFNKAIDKDTVINKDTDKLAANDIIGIAKVAGDGTVATINTNSLASLSADGKTLTITAAASSFDNYKYVVTVNENKVKTAEGKFIKKYVSNVLETPDKVAPVVSSVEKKNASTVRVNFSEPIAVAGNWTFKLADGTTADVTVNSDNIAKGYIDLVIGSVDAEKTISVTGIGVKDYAGNLTSPNPITLDIQKGKLDGTKPTVSSITPLSLNKFEVKFSEEVQGFDGTDLSINGVNLNNVTSGDSTVLEAGEAKVTQDKTDKSKFTVQLGTALSSGLNTIGLDENGVTDLSGETNKAYSKVVEFVQDTTAPTLVSSEVKKDVNGYEYLHLTFSESVDANSLTALAATQVKDYVTTTDTIDLSAAEVVPNTDDKEYKVRLADVAFDSAALVKGAAYTVTLTGAFEDKSNNAIESKKITFTRGTDSLTEALKVSSVLPVNGTTNKVAVTFDQPVDGETASNAANYKIDGVVVEKAEIYAAGSSVVTLTLKDDSNTLSGARAVTISGVKAKDGVVMDKAYTGSVALTENVAPTFTAQLTSNDTITLTFSENVVVSSVDAADLDVFVDNTKESEASPFAIAAVDAVNGNAKKFTITLTNDLTAAEFAKAITVKSVLESGDEIVDVNGNKIKAATVTVTK